MKTKFARLFQIFIILMFLLGSANLQPVFAQDETPVVTEPVVVVTDAPVEVATEQILVTEVPATEVVTEILTEVPTEVPTEAEDFSQVVEILNEEDMTLTDATGEALALGSLEAAEVLGSNDPFFYNTAVQTDGLGNVLAANTWIGYTLTGTGCPTNVVCYMAAQPFQATVNAAPANATIYVASGTYEEDVVLNNIMNTNANLSLASFNTVTVATNGTATITNPGFATVRSFTLNANLNITNGVFGNSILVNSGGYLSDALALANPLNNNATIEADVKLAGMGGNFTIQDAYHTSDPTYEGGCGEPDKTIYTGTKYHMILKTPYNKDVNDYYKADLGETETQVTAQIEDLMLAAGVSEEDKWSTDDKQMVYWYLLGQIEWSDLSGNKDNQGQKKLATQITEMIFNSDDLSQKLWFLWPVYKDNPNNPVSPSNTQLTFLKLPIPTTGDDKKITICHAAGKAGDPANFVTLNLSVNAVYGNGGHFNNNGTYRAGHEKDYLGPCIDVCSNIEGNQQTIPAGQMTNGTGSCMAIVKSLSIEKTVAPLTFSAVGDELSYEYVVNNTGNVELTGLTVTDDKLLVTCPVSTLAAGASTTCTVKYKIQQLDLDSGSITNIVHADASYGNSAVASGTDTATATAIANPVLTIEKSVTPTTYSAVGDELSYEYEITNTGNVTLTDLSVEDDKVTVSCSVSSLAPSESTTCTSSYTIDQSDLDDGSVTNIAHAEAIFGNTPVGTGNDTVTATAIKAPSISIQKSANESSYDATIDTLNYNYLITNTGNVTLTGQFTISDNKFNGGAAFNCGDAITVLAPKGTLSCGSAPYSVSQADLDNGSVTNAAFASLGTLVSEPDEVTVMAVANPSISISKSADKVSYDSITDTLNYNYLITNTGNVTLTGQFMVTDDKINSNTAFTCGTAGMVLAPLATLSCESAPYDVTQADLDAGSVKNTAFASLGSLKSNNDDVTVNASTLPGLSILKSSDETSYDATTDTLNYNYLITNTGNVTLTGQFTVTDDKINGGAAFNCGVAATVLAPLATVSCESAAYAVTQDDLDAGLVKNTAFASVEKLNSPTDSVTINAVQDPALSVEKTVTSTGPYLLGSTISYNIVVTNTGNVTLNNVNITDPAAVLGTCPVTATLAVGATKSCTASHVVVAADVTAGIFTNTSIGDSDETTPISSSVSSTITAPTIIPPLVPVTGGTPPALLIPVTGGQLIPVTGGTLIVSGLGHSCMNYNNGQVICWGLNASGQVGDGTFKDQYKPVFVKNLEGVLNLTAGSKHTCALTIDGDIWCWGENSSGQLGDGSTVNSNVPVKVVGLPEKVLAITAGEEFTCAQLMNQDVWCWGKNNLGQLNDGTTKNQLEPVKSKLNTMLAQISGGQGLLLGSDFFGSVNEWAKVEAAAVKQLAGSLSISANRWGDTGCAVASDGSVKCWDSNLISAPIKDTFPAMEVGAGMEHNCVVNNDQTVSCWGVNLSGQLGNGSNTDSLAATLVKNMSKVRALGVGANHTCVLSGSNNTPMCWGENTFGQLGNDATTNSNLPVYVIIPVIP